jgi:hypothetical protein
MDGWVVV